MSIVFDDMITDIESNKKKLSLTVTELFLRGSKLSISLAFVSQSYFKVRKTIRLNATHYFIIKIPNKNKLSISLVFISQSYFKVPKTIRLNATHYFIIKIPNKRELQQIAPNHSSDIDFKGIMKLYKEYTKDSYSLLVNDMTLPSHNPL